MQSHEIDEAADAAFREHAQLLVRVLLTEHSPFNPPEVNDQKVRHFEVGLKHLLGVRQLVDDSIARITTEHDPK